LIQARFRHFAVIREDRCNEASAVKEKISGLRTGIGAADF
jgi:hypothetical protein